MIQELLLVVSYIDSVETVPVLGLGSSLALDEFEFICFGGPLGSEVFGLDPMNCVF